MEATQFWIWFKGIGGKTVPMGVVVVVLVAVVVALVTSKKPKQKKVPQRGLGVAQLEKIRLEEQQKNLHSTQQQPNSPVALPNYGSQANLIQNFHHSNRPNSPIGLPSGPPADLWSPMSLQQLMDAKVPNRSTIPLANGSGDFQAGWHNRSTVPMANGSGECQAGLHNRSTVPLANGSGEFQAGWHPRSTVPLANSGEFQARWHPNNAAKFGGSREFDFERERSRVDPPGVPFLPSLSADSNHNWPLPNLGQRTTQHHHHSSSMANVSSGTSSAPVHHFSIEPPSNQNYSGSLAPVTPTEKMVGMKRPYPFSMDVPPVPTFNYKPPTFGETQTNATNRCGSGSGFNFDAAGHSTVREVPSCSAASNTEPNSRKINNESEGFNVDFLSLAPPTPTSCRPSELKSSSASLAFRNQENRELESPSFEGFIEDRAPPQPGNNRSNQQRQPVFCFFPLAAAEDSEIGQTTQNGNEEGKLDLNLKL